jgi:hypothetical protein
MANLRMMSGDRDKEAIELLNLVYRGIFDNIKHSSE